MFQWRQVRFAFIDTTIWKSSFLTPHFSFIELLFMFLWACYQLPRAFAMAWVRFAMAAARALLDGLLLITEANWVMA